MRSTTLCILLMLAIFSTQAQDQGFRNTILQKLDAFKEKSLAITRPETPFDQATLYQLDIFNMFLAPDVLIEAGINKGDEKTVVQRVYRADELGAWLRSLARTQNSNLQSINFQQVEIYWVTGIEKVSKDKYRVLAWVLPWDRIAYREGDVTKTPGVREVARELSKNRVMEIMNSGEEIFIGYLKMALMDRPTTADNMRLGNTQNQTVHTVQPGETLFSIAMKHKVEIGDIMADNNLSSTTIHAGQNLVIGRNQYTQPETADSRLPDYLNPSNQRTSEPEASPFKFRPVYYTIRQGENARSIAARHKLDYQQLLNWNPYAEFKVGEKVIIDMLAVE